MTKFNRVLIVNRGEIAVRIIRALRDLGLQSVAVYSDADATSLHRKLADFAVPLAGNTPAETYLNTDKIMAAIRSSGADAIHPGYGFLSENAAFAKQIETAGLTFIGPSADAMHKMGDKIEARRLMRAAHVPITPGSDDPLTDWQELKELAKEIGYPMILKAAAGGGGRGMRIVESEDQLESSFKTCQREAQEYFGNQAIFCERYIATARHIEFQVLFDGHGNGVHLYERDCSVQRRHQKLLEEAPSTFLNPEARAKLGETAVLAGKAVNYCGVGTIEFICESPERCYFMEMNTRIQVEHPVTEMITGIDLIGEQIRVAQGETLRIKQEDIKLTGWSFETRINAEDPEKDFMPIPGRIEHLRFPSGPFVRVDSHLYAGYEIPSHYDSMIAKIITWGQDRKEAMQRMRRALSEMEIQGVPTTALFHEAVFDDKDFCAGNFTTSFIADKQTQLSARMRSNPNTDVRQKDLSALLSVVLLKTRQQKRPLPSKNSRKRWQQTGRNEAVRSQ